MCSVSVQCRPEVAGCGWECPKQKGEAASSLLCKMVAVYVKEAYDVHEAKSNMTKSGRK